MKSSGGTPPAALGHARADRSIERLASKQHGVVTRAQILDIGVSSKTLDRRIEAGLLRPLHRGVYVVGPVVTAEAIGMAAVLACGSRALVSHWSAGGLWTLLAVSAARRVDVLLTGGDRRRSGIRIHYASKLWPDERTMRGRIPITTPARTLLDLAAVAGAYEVERALVEAFGKRLTGHTELSALVERHRRHAGAARLRARIGCAQPSLTRSAAELRFLSLIRTTRLVSPEVNVPVAGIEVDFYWRSEGVVVEVDGFAFHSTAGRFERDRRRDLELAAAGVRVIRVTWRQLTREPEALLDRLRRVLAAEAAG